jgi:uracil phosphoribosyltransferase
MGDGMMELLPDASVHHIGMYRAKGSLLPIQYYNRLPRDEKCDVAFITDPCIATSNTLQAAVSIVKRWGAKKIIVIAAIGAKEGVDALLAAHPDIDIYIGEIDNTLTEEGMILPGIGDAGDRLFSTPSDEVVVASDENSPKKRKH